MAAYGFASAKDIKRVLQSSKPGLTGEKLVKYGFISPHSLEFILKEQTKIRLSELIQKDLSYSIEVEKLSLNSVSESFDLKDMKILLAETLWSKISTEWIRDFFELKSSDTIHRVADVKIGKDKDQTGWIKKCKDILPLIQGGGHLSRVVNNAVDTLSLLKKKKCSFAYIICLL